MSLVREFEKGLADEKRAKDDRDRVAIGAKPKSPAVRIFGWLGFALWMDLTWDFYGNRVAEILVPIALIAASYNGYKAYLYYLRPKKYQEKYVVSQEEMIAPTEPSDRAGAKPVELELPGDDNPGENFGPRAGVLVFLSPEPQSRGDVEAYYIKTHGFKGLVKTFDELVDAGLIQRTTQGRAPRRKHFYSLTEAGIQKRQELLAQADPPHEGNAPSRPPPVHAEIRS